MSAEIIDFPARPRPKSLRELVCATLDAASGPPKPGEDPAIAIIRACLAQATPMTPPAG